MVHSNNQGFKSDILCTKQPHGKLFHGVYCFSLSAPYSVQVKGQLNYSSLKI